MKKAIGLYLRVSTDEQNEDLQRNELRFRVAEFEAAGHEVRVYLDKFTGTTMDRPDWRRLETDLRAGEISTILVWRIDRLGRTASGLTALFTDLSERGVNLISHRDGVDLSTPSGRLLANVLASMSQYETEVRQERQTAGIAAAKAAGKKWGGSEKGKRQKRTKQMPVHVLRLRDQGCSVSRIATKLGMCRKTVRKILRDHPVATQPEQLVQS